jgi:hypothetical protein
MARFSEDALSASYGVETPKAKLSKTSASTGFVLVGMPRRIERVSLDVGRITTHYDQSGIMVETYSGAWMRGFVYVHREDLGRCECLPPEDALALSSALWFEWLSTCGGDANLTLSRALWTAALCEDCQ